MATTWRVMAPVAFSVALGVVALATSIGSAAVYDFEGLSAAPLIGQDNWTNQFGSTDIDVTTGTGVNTSDVATSNVNAAVLPYRQNDGSFSFPTFAGTETSALLEFDLFKGGIFGGTMYMLNGGAAPFGPTFGITNTNKFYIRGANNGTENEVLDNVDLNDWIRLRLVIDFTANGGDGSGDFSYQNLTDGETAFTSVAGLQNINLQINSGPAPTTWDTVGFRVDQIDVAVDNLRVELVAPVLGDFSGDGLVNTVDYDIMRANWLSTGNELNVNGEVTGDGIVDLADFREFKNSLFVGPLSASLSQIPEPSTVVLLLAAAPAWLAIRSRGRKKA